MGANYGAVYLRGAGTRQVRSLLSQWAAEQNGRCLLAPKMRGWLAVYPQDYGVDPELAERLAASTRAVVLHVFVHDDSLLGYSFFRDGRLVDEYCSDPEYAEEASSEEIERLHGRPELLADLLGNPADVAVLDEVLHPADGTLGFAGFALKEFARLLNLPNACTCYEYLMEDGWFERLTRVVAIRGLWRFRHIPSLRAEKRARRHRLSRRADAWQELKRQGSLWMYQQGRIGWLFSSEPHLCPSAAGDGFYVTWENDWQKPLEEISPPWSEFRPAGLESDCSCQAMATSPSGRWLVVSEKTEDGHAELWDMSQSVKVADLPDASAGAFDFTADESMVLAIGNGSLSVLELPSGKLLKQAKLGGYVSQGVFDPSGRLAVLISSDELVLFDWQRGKRLRRWKLGQPVVPPIEQQFLQEELQEQLEEMTPTDFEKHFRKMAGQLRLSTEQVETMLVDVRQQHDEMMAAVHSGKWARQAAAPTGSEMPVRVQFSRDGQWLLCATDQGPRVYRWAEFPGVLSALEGAEEPKTSEPSSAKKKKRKSIQFAPRPVYSVEGGDYQEEGEEEHHCDINPGRYIYALTYDPQRELLLYGGMAGTIGAIDLASGEHRTLVELPSRPTIMELSLSRDGRALGCTTFPQFHRDNKKIAPEVCVWDYAKLLG